MLLQLLLHYIIFNAFFVLKIVFKSFLFCFCLFIIIAVIATLLLL